MSGTILSSCNDSVDKRDKNCCHAIVCSGRSGENAQMRQTIGYKRNKYLVFSRWKDLWKTVSFIPNLSVDLEYFIKSDRF